MQHKISQSPQSKRNRVIRPRFMIAIIATLCLICFGGIWILSVGRIVAGVWAYILPIAFTVVGVILMLFQLLFSPSNSSTNQAEPLKEKAKYEPHFEAPLQGIVVGEHNKINIYQGGHEETSVQNTLKDSKIERLRRSYDIIGKAANNYRTILERMIHIPSPGHISPTDEDAAQTEISLGDISIDIKTIFSELQGAFYEYTTWLSIRDWQEAQKYKKIAIEKYEELEAVMSKHLKDLYS